MALGSKPSQAANGEWRITNSFSPQGGSPNGAVTQIVRGRDIIGGPSPAAKTQPKQIIGGGSGYIGGPSRPKQIIGGGRGGSGGGGSYTGLPPAYGGGFTDADTKEAKFREAKFREAAIVKAAVAQNPTAGALERMRRAQQASSQAATTTAGQALAGGGFGSTRAALLGMARMRAQGASQGALAADQVAEQDLGRQQQTNLFNADAENTGSMFNAGAYNDNSRFNAGAYNDNSQFNADSYNNTSRFNAGAANDWNKTAADMGYRAQQDKNEWDFRREQSAADLAWQREQLDKNLGWQRDQFNYQKERDAAAEKLRKEAEFRTRQKSQGPDIWYAQDSLVGGMRHTGPMVRLPNGTSIPLSTWRRAGFGGQ